MEAAGPERGGKEWGGGRGTHRANMLNQLRRGTGEKRKKQRKKLFGNIFSSGDARPPRTAQEGTAPSGCCFEKW